MLCWFIHAAQSCLFQSKLKLWGFKPLKANKCFLLLTTNKWMCYIMSSYHKYFSIISSSSSTCWIISTHRLPNVDFVATRLSKLYVSLLLLSELCPGLKAHINLCCSSNEKPRKTRPPWFKILPWRSFPLWLWPASSTWRILFIFVPRDASILMNYRYRDSCQVLGRMWSSLLLKHQGDSHSMNISLMIFSDC